MEQTLGIAEIPKRYLEIAQHFRLGLTDTGFYASGHGTNFMLQSLVPILLGAP